MLLVISANPLISLSIKLVACGTLEKLGSKLWEPQKIRHAELRHPGLDPGSGIQRFDLTG